MFWVTNAWGDPREGWQESEEDKDTWQDSRDTCQDSRDAWQDSRGSGDVAKTRFATVQDEFAGLGVQHWTDG